MNESRSNDGKKEKSMRTIRVTGKGQLNVKPDTTVITIELRGADKQYHQTLTKSSYESESLKRMLVDLGFKKEDIKTSRFNIDTKEERYQHRDSNRTRVVGYQYVHIMKVQFLSDNQRLGTILNQLALSRLNPEFRISYTVSDPESQKNLLLEKAITDAKQKAIHLAQAAQVKLKDIQTIDYSWLDIDFEVSPVYQSFKASTPAYELDIEPEEIDIAENVTVVWEIE